MTNVPVGHANIVDSRALLTERPTQAKIKLAAGPKSISALTSGVTVLVLGLLWWQITDHKLVSSLFLPGPLEVWRQAIAIWQNGYAGASLLSHVLASLSRVSVAFGFALLLGAPLGLLMGMNAWIKGIFDPPIAFYWPIPPLAYLPLMIIWLGIGETSKIVLLGLAMFAPICMAAQAGVRGIADEQIKATLCLGATPWHVFRHVVLPGALPDILTGARIAVGVGWGTLVAAELVAATKGVGFMIMSASHFLATDVVFFGIGLIAALAFSFSFILRRIEKSMVPWKGKS